MLKRKEKNQPVHFLLSYSGRRRSGWRPGPGREAMEQENSTDAAWPSGTKSFLASSSHFYNLRTN